jgi:T5SS/PEP-CTERM-associated repeat protein
MRRDSFILPCAALLAVTLGSSPVRAVAKNWNDGTGNWNVAGNWSPASVPVAGEAVNIVFTDGVARTVTYNVSAPSLGLFSVDLTGPDTTASALSITSNFNLAANGILIGGYNGLTTTAGRGAMTQSAGTVSTNAGWDFVLGYGAGSTGTYSLSGTGALTANQSEYVGLSGTGTFTQLAGTNTITSASAFFILGLNSGSTGTYNLSGTGTLLSNSNLRVGDIGTGFFNQTGGTYNNGASLYLGYNASGGGGTYTLSAGTLTWFGSGANGAEYVGYGSTGTFNQSGGTNTVWGTGLHIGTLAGSTGLYTLSAGWLGSEGGEVIGDFGTGTLTQTGGFNGTGSGSDIFLGYNAGSNGIYNLSGTGELNSGHDLYIGFGGAGTLNQNGGAVSTFENFSLGYAAGSTGIYNLTAGSLQTADFSSYSANIGQGGTGTFSQSGGTSTFGANGVVLGLNAGGGGSFLLSGGSASVVGVALAVGGTIYGSGGTGVLSVSDTGVLTVTGTLLAYNTAGTVINLSGGTTNVGALNFNGTPTLLNWTGGKLNLTTSVTWDSAADATSTSAAFGSALSLGLDQTLMITGNETLGGTGTFALTLESGSTHHVTSSLTLSPTGTITQNTGSTLYAATFTQAGGTVNGTLQNQGNFVYQSGQFNGRLLNQGTVSLGPFFTAGNGVQNDASMTFNAGQTLTVNGAGLDNLGMFTLNGGTISGNGAVVNNYGGTLQAHGTINPTFTNNGVLQVDGVLRLNGASATNNGVVFGSGTVIGNFVNAAGGTLGLTNGNLMAISAAIDSDSDGNIDWSNAGLVTLNGNAVLGGSQIINSGTVDGAGTINAPIANSGVVRAASGQLNLAAVGNTNLAAGLIQAATGNTVMVLQGLTANAGTIGLTGGAFDNNNHPLSNTGIINGYGTIRTSALTNANKLNVGEGNMDVFGAVINNGTIGIQGGRSAYFFGDVSGSGNYTGLGTAVFLAAVSPGNSPASVSFGGNANLASTSTLNIELGGTTPGTQYDQLLVTGQLWLGGALQVSLINSFAPAAGDSFNILDWGSLTGTFDTLVLPEIASSLSWDTSQLYNTGVISVASVGLPGDYNHNGVVDAADYVVWRKGLGTIYTPDDYNVWRANFGQTAGSGSGSVATAGLPSSAVPEPAAWLILLTGLVMLVSRRTAEL